MVDIVLLEKLEKRWKELVGKPRSDIEIQESLSLAKQIELERAKEHQLLTDELFQTGIYIETIWDLVNTKSKYSNAIPILMKHLQLDYSDKVKEGIVRALTVPEAKGLVVPLLLKEYNKLTNDMQNLKWVIGNAVYVTITKKDIEDIFPIVLNNENGLSRQMLVAALGKFKIESVRKILVNLVKDENKTIRDEANKALKKM